MNEWKLNHTLVQEFIAVVVHYPVAAGEFGEEVPFARTAPPNPSSRRQLHTSDINDDRPCDNI